ncbi:MAG: hypothetical protein A2047_01270 [Omnitrophica bacterium GWA2_41_15]|nr:MAG: hypothetical protein A2047_01270 [Omnitrophica bacterium GWA2_41_15]HAZ09550.1 hypothetical protein [Candidatus Omnitrophota bacterium]
MNAQAMSMDERIFVASHLRSQLTRLQHVLDVVEEKNEVECDFTHESIKEIEIKLRQLRKLCAN